MFFYSWEISQKLPIHLKSHLFRNKYINTLRRDGASKVKVKQLTCNFLPQRFFRPFSVATFLVKITRCGSLCDERHRNKYNHKLVQDGLYLFQGMTILSSTLSMIPITSCGRLPFPVHCILFILLQSNTYPERFNCVHDRFPFICSTRKNWLVFAFLRLHRWIKLCKTVNKIILFLLYVTKDMIHTKCTDTKVRR